MKITKKLEHILKRSARPVAVQCTEAEGRKLEELGLAEIVSRNPTPFVIITELGRQQLGDQSK